MNAPSLNVEMVSQLAHDCHETLLGLIAINDHAMPTDEGKSTASRMIARLQRVRVDLVLAGSHFEKPPAVDSRVFPPEIPAPQPLTDVEAGIHQFLGWYLQNSAAMHLLPHIPLANQLTVQCRIIGHITDGSRFREDRHQIRGLAFILAELHAEMEAAKHRAHHAQAQTASTA